jgi:uncharacterized phosphosugar-binding protein
MNKIVDYSQKIHAILDKIVETQTGQIEKAAQLVADTVARDGIIYTFGTGHSHVIAEDVAYRAGGLVPVDAILEPSLTGHEKVMQSEYMERVEGMAEVILNYYEISPKDALIIISNSGRNAAPIEMAQGAHKRGVSTIAVTSLAHSQGTTSRHSSGEKLYQIADIVITIALGEMHCSNWKDYPSLPAPVRESPVYSSFNPLWCRQFKIFLTVELPLRCA